MSSESLYKCITNKAAVVNNWIDQIQRRYEKSVVGLDTEWLRIKDEKTKAQQHRIAILQLCVEDRCLIFQMCWMDSMPSSLSKFLMDPNFIFVGAGISGDLNMLRDEYNLNCAESKDLAAVAKKKWRGKWPQTPGLKTLAREVAGIEMEKDKKITLSNWGWRYLSKKQVEYAALDAYASYKVGVELQDCFDCPSPCMYDDDYYSDNDYDYFI